MATVDAVILGLGYVGLPLAQEATRGEKVQEATDQAAYAAAPWDFDGVWLHIDLANGRIGAMSEFVLALALNSRDGTDILHAPIAAPEVSSAASGTAESGDRVVEARVAWSALLRHATNDRPELAQRLGGIGPGFRFGCEPMLIEFDHTRQSFIGGAHYIKPSGRDVNSRDVVLRGPRK